MIDENVIYTLTFNAPGYKFNELTVTSHNLDMLKKFIHIHLTEEACQYIQAYDYNHAPKDIMTNEDETDLDYYIFRENGTSDCYSIPSSDEIIMATAAEVCNVLSNISKFDRLINSNIEVLRVLNESIGDLKFGYILEPNYSQPPPGSSAYSDYKRSINLGDETDYTDDEMGIYESMMSRIRSVHIREPLPFTMRGYVSAFTKLLLVENKRR